LLFALSRQTQRSRSPRGGPCYLFPFQNCPMFSCSHTFSLFVLLLINSLTMFSSFYLLIFVPLFRQTPGRPSKKKSRSFPTQDSLVIITVVKPFLSNCIMILFFSFYFLEVPMNAYSEKCREILLTTYCYNYVVFQFD